MEENNKKNPDSERKSKLLSAVLMAFVCILMMGGGTYAWFTMNNNAKVTSLKLNVASEGNLYIGKSQSEAEGKTKIEVPWYDLEEDKDVVTTLYPCTSNDGVTMYRPVYKKDDVVSDVDAIDPQNDTDRDSYYLQKSFWLFLDDGGTTNDYTVHLAKGTDLTSSSERDGTYFICTEETTPTYLPQYCVRVSFTTDSSTYVYEPNSDGTNTGIQIADDNISESFVPVEAEYKQTITGEWVDSTNAKESDAMFEIKGGTAKEVVVRVWFEGTDTDCGNDIELNDIMGQFKFVANKKVNN